MDALKTLAVSFQPMVLQVHCDDRIFRRFGGCVRGWRELRDEKFLEEHPHDGYSVDPLLAGCVLWFGVFSGLLRQSTVEPGYSSGLLL